MGTGDGRAVIAAAAAAPRTLVIGIDADAASMAESARRAARPPRRGGLANALFAVAAAEAMPGELAGVADRVTVTLPWGSLLRGVLGREASVAAGLAALLRPAATLEILLAPSPRDRLDGLPTDPGEVAQAVAGAFGLVGLQLAEARLATEAELRATNSTWAKRLLAVGPSRAADRPAIVVRLRS